VESQFLPSRRTGIIFQGVLLLVLLGGGGVSFASSLQQGVGSDLVFYLILSVLLLAPTPVIAYRLYALFQATYTLERDGLRIRWGLRGEDIPLTQIDWVRPASDMGFAMRMPITSMPGAFLGLTNVEGLGTVEYMASDVRTMLLVATPNKVYAISPADPNAFVRSFRKMIELGSLSPLPLYSTRPVAFLERVWGDRLARTMLIVGFALTAALFILVSLRIPTLRAVSLGFDATLKPFDSGPAESLLLLAVLGGFSYAVDLLVGLFFYRRDESHTLAYLLWGASIAAPLLLLAGAIIAR
jgi:hypothetical protein